MCMKFAGNVLVYGAMSPSDGDWFGGINASNAEAFLDALLQLQVASSDCSSQAIMLHACLSCWLEHMHMILCIKGKSEPPVVQRLGLPL